MQASVEMILDTNYHVKFAPYLWRTKYLSHVLLFCLMECNTSHYGHNLLTIHGGPSVRVCSNRSLEHIVRRSVYICFTIRADIRLVLCPWSLFTCDLTAQRAVKIAVRKISCSLFTFLHSEHHCMPTF